MRLSGENGVIENVGKDGMRGSIEEMNSDKRLRDRNAAIEELLKDGKKLRAFYRFASQNPKIELHDACQIILNRPSASVCYSFEDWEKWTVGARRIGKESRTMIGTETSVMYLTFVTRTEKKDTYATFIQ